MKAQGRQSERRGERSKTEKGRASKDGDMHTGMTLRKAELLERWMGSIPVRGGEHATHRMR